jgi:ribosomal protein L37E
VSKYVNNYGYNSKPLVAHPVRHVMCELCGRAWMIRVGTDQPKVCSQCGHAYGDAVPINTYASDEAKPTTHHQYRVFCGVCKHRAIEWVAKKHKGSIPCRECGETGYKVRYTKIKPEGDCATSDLWATRGFQPVGVNTKPKRKRFQCPSCGRLHFYIIKPPAICANCGDEMPYDQIKSSSAS